MTRSNRGDRFASRRAVVFGGGTSEDDRSADAPEPIGRAIATTLAAQGAHVTVVDRDPHAAHRTVEAIRTSGGSATALTADVTDPGDVDRAVDSMAGDGPVDIVCNNVGNARLAGLEELDLDAWRAAVAVNLDSVYLTARAVMPHLVRSRGAMVNVSSLASTRWTGYAYPAYAAAKAGVNQLTTVLALQYADRGVRVNAVLAGLIDTPLVYRELAGAADAASVRAERDRHSPTGRCGTARQVADAVAFLASAEASYVNGVLLPVDGGLHARAL